MWYQKESVGYICQDLIFSQIWLSWLLSLFLSKESALKIWFPKKVLDLESGFEQGIIIPIGCVS